MPADLRISQSHRVYLRRPRYRLDLTGGYVFSEEKPKRGTGNGSIVDASDDCRVADASARSGVPGQLHNALFSSGGFA